MSEPTRNWITKLADREFKLTGVRAHSVALATLESADFGTLAELGVRTGEPVEVIVWPLNDDNTPAGEATRHVVKVAEIRAVRVKGDA